MWSLRWLTPLFVAFLSLAQSSLPQPPQQNTPWHSPPLADIPEHIPQAFARLFDAGMADPRGGEYCQFETGQHLLNGRILPRRGWCFPGGFAVGWDAFIYRTQQPIKHLDLRHDVTAAIGGDHLRSVPINIVAGALLLRLGEADLARQVLLLVRNVARQQVLFLDATQFQQHAVTIWLSHIFHRAVEAHATADDRRAIEIAEWLLAVRPVAAKLSPASDLSFLDPLPTLTADSQRRLKQPARLPLHFLNLHDMPQPDRIAELIRRLEDVAERQWGQPGGVELLRSPICRMLAEEGAATIEPLIDVMDNDQRLTRSFSYARDFFPPRNLITTAQAAHAILLRHYQIAFPMNDKAKRRQWLLRNRDRTLAERAFDLLADDSNAESQWLNAAQVLLLPERPAPGRVGDMLRPTHQNPSVSLLLARRALQMQSTWAGTLTQLLVQWDPQSPLPLLADLARRPFGTPYGPVAEAWIQFEGPNTLEHLAIPAFRESLLRALRRQEPLTNSGNQGVRIADYIAWRLSQITGFPKFDLQWTLEQKDQALIRIAEQLQ